MPELTTSQAINAALELILNDYESSFIAGEDIGVYGGAFGVTEGLLEKFGDHRVKDTPIAEDVIAGMAVGAAMTHSRPIVEMQFSDFIVNAMDPIVNQAAKLHFMYGGAVNVPIVVRGASGGGTGAAAQHSQSLESWFCHIPGLKVVAPSSPQSAYDLLLHSFIDENPVIFMEHKLIYKIREEVLLNPLPKYSNKLGKSNVIKKGSDITIVSYSQMINVVKEAIASDELKNFDIELIDLQTLSPIDIQTIQNSVQKTEKLLVVQEAPGNSSVGATVIAKIVGSELFSKLKAPPKLLAGLHSPMPSAKHLETSVIPQPENVIQILKSML